MTLGNLADISSDGNIRYFEYQNDKFEFLTEYKSADPQRGIAFLPKRGVNVHENEVMRAFKTVNDTYIEPISFIVPRRAEVFQDDIYPPATGSKPAVSKSEWYAGKDGVPAKIDLASIYAGEEPSEVPSDYKPPTREPSPPPPVAKKAEPVPDPEPAEPSAAIKGPPPSMKEQTASVKEFASKYHDEEDDTVEDDSSFEEVPKPVDRSAHQQANAPAQSQPAPIRQLGDGLSAVKDKPDDFDKASQFAASQSTKSQIEAQAAPLSETKAEPLKEQLPPSKVDSPQQGGEVQASLAEIKNLLQQQNRAMSAQNETIGKLTAEVDRLRSKLGE